MTQVVRLNTIEGLVIEHSFPMSKRAAIRTFGDLRLDLADGTVSMGETIGRSNVTRFDTSSDLLDELYQTLPRRAVGEPFQSEGDA